MNSPIISFKDEKTIDIISDWLDIDSDYVFTYMGIILGKLGFKEEDNIYVYDNSKTRSLYLMVNDKEEYTIRINNNEEEKPVLYFVNNGVEIGYQCIIDKYGRFEVGLNPIKFSGIKDDVIYTNEVSDEYFDYEVNNGEYQLEFRISKLNGLGLRNQSDLVSYLTGLKFPVSIFDVYKKICEMSIAFDISKYSVIDLRIFKFDEYGLIDENNNDMIILENGKLVSLSVSKDGRVVYYNCDGSWSYNTDTVAVDFSVCKVGDMFDFNSRVRPKNIDNYRLDMASIDVNEAKEEIANVKKLVKTIFVKKR